MRVRMIVGVVIGAAALVAGLASSPASASVDSSVAAEQEYFWKWSDGSQATHRTFSQKKYGIQNNLPELVVTAVPARPRHYVYLQFRQGGKWVLENKVALNSKGVAHVDINPYCENDTWCDGTYKYRLKVVDSYANLTITYTER